MIHKSFKTSIGRDDRSVIAGSQSQAGQDLFVIAMTQGKTEGRWLELGAGQPVTDNNTWLLEHQFRWSGFSLEIEDPNLSQKQNRWRAWYSNIRGCFFDDPPVEWASNPTQLSDLPVEIQKQLIEIHHYEEAMKNSGDFVLPVQPIDDWRLQRPAADFIVADAACFDYSQLTGPFDYLQIDIDAGPASVRCLQSVLKHHKPSVITYEHDFFTGSEMSRFSRKASRQVLHDAGYVLIANDVTCEPHKGWTIENRPIYFEDWYAHPDFVPRYLIDIYRTVSQDLYPKYFSQILFES